jgi:hypothetical protein
MTKKQFIIGGRTIDIFSLTQPLDQAFISLHAAYFGSQAMDWADAYFDNFTIIWNAFLASGNFDEAERVWSKALAPALKWEQAHPPERIHKGTAYYF